MRITNNMMMKSTSININGNKLNVNELNNQMTSQKKIQRPSENPVIAIRALRLRSNLSEIDQYYENNIPDAESWMDVTETAIKNMQKILEDIRTQCTYGSNDPLFMDDRKTILTQLEKLRDQVYAEGNTDYAGRTVFTGYRTNQKLTFMEKDTKTSYDITHSLSFKDIEEHRYYSDEVTLPTTKDEVYGPNALPISDPKEAIFDRIRLGYGGIESITGTNAGGNAATATTNGDKVNVPFSYTDANGTAQNGNLNVTVYDTFEDWAANANNAYKINEDTDGDGKPDTPSAVLIKETGELVLGEHASSELRSKKAELDFNYKKTGFEKGELRPEYYYNCTDVTDPNNPVKFIKYENGEEVRQDINYMVAINQTLTVNVSASDVFDSSVGRDVDAMIEAIRFGIEANEKVEKLEKMKKMEEYSSDDAQAALEKWITAAKKEADYADDNVQKLYNTYIGKCDKYLEKVNLAYTDVGSRGVSLELTKNRMENQQTTIETLKSTNEDRDLSDIILEFTQAYNAYQGSLQAASKINQNTLLNFI